MKLVMHFSVIEIGFLLTVCK